jgi:hypothetical protein
MANTSEIEQLDALAKMRERFRLAEEAETLNRIAAEEALRFYFGEQWETAVQQQRTLDGRPCFTLNKLPAIIRQILNEARANRPAIQVNPVSDGASEDGAEIVQGLCRHVENNGEGAEVAYDCGFEYLVLAGFGHWRVLTDFLPKSFNQDAFLERIRNPFSVYWDPNSKKLDKSDARYCFITHDYTPEAHEAEFPDAELSSAADYAGIGDQAMGWITTAKIRVVEYFEIREEKTRLVLLADGSAAYEDEIPEGAQIAKQGGAPVTRPATRRSAWVAKSNGVEWLEAPRALPTDDIPVVSVFADELMVDGEFRIKGAVQDLIEPARLFNYNSSGVAESIALGSKSTWLATAEQIEPYMSIWQQSNIRNFAALPYKNLPGVNPPQKIATEPPIEAISEARAQSADDLRSISGVYDATQSPNGGEESGRAILARRRQAVTGNAHYRANMARGIKRTAQILLKLFPTIYDTPRMMRILGVDLQPKTVIVHAGADASEIPPFDPKAVESIYDLSAGEYEIVIDTGSAETKRQEALELMLGLCEANPAIVPIIGDLVVNEMDFAGKKAVVARLQKALPPNLQDANPTDPNQLAAHNTQLMQQNQALMQQVQKITQVLQTKQIENASRERVEGMKLQAAQVRAEAGLEQERIKAQSSILTKMADQHVSIVHDHAMADKANEHERALKTLDQVHAMMSAPAPGAAFAPPAAGAPGGGGAA